MNLEEIAELATEVPNEAPLVQLSEAQANALQKFIQEMDKAQKEEGFVYNYPDQLKNIRKIYSSADRKDLTCPEDFLSSLKVGLESELAIKCVKKKLPSEWSILIDLAAVASTDNSPTVKLKIPSFAPAETKKKIDSLKSFYGGMRNALQSIQATRDVFADLMKKRSELWSVPLAGSGNSQVLPLEFFGVGNDLPKPLIRNLHACRKASQNGDDVVFDIYVSGENLGNYPQVKILTQKDGKPVGEVVGKPNYDKDKNLVSLAYTLKKSELEACTVFKIGDATSELKCFTDNVIKPPEPTFKYSLKIESGDGASIEKPIKPKKPAKAIGNSGETKSMPDAVWSEEVTGTGNIDLLKTAIEKLDNSPKNQEKSTNQDSTTKQKQPICLCN